MEGEQKAGVIMGGREGSPRTTGSRPGARRPHITLSASGERVRRKIHLNEPRPIEREPRLGMVTPYQKALQYVRASGGRKYPEKLFTVFHSDP